MWRMLVIVVGLVACGGGGGGGGGSGSGSGGDDGDRDECVPSAGAPYTYIKSTMTHADDQFGWTLALSGDSSTLAVASPYASFDEATLTAGAVSVYARCGAAWVAQGWLEAPADATGIFGTGIALSANGSTLAVGALDASAGEHSGSVYLYTRAAGVWLPQAHLVASDGGAHDAFGNGVALSASGDVLAVGAPYRDQEAGAVYVYTRAGGTWTQRAELTVPTSDQLGLQVALSADGATLAASAPNEQLFDAPDGSFGAAYVFGFDGASWHPQARLEPTALDAKVYFASAIALSADGATVAASGSRPFTDPPLPNTVDVFTRSAGAWTAQGTVEISQSNPFADNTALLALSGNGKTLVVGQPSENGADVYTRAGPAWSAPHRLAPAHPQARAKFGTTVAISDDAGTLAVGAPFEASAATGVAPDGELDTSAPDAGAVFVIEAP